MLKFGQLYVKEKWRCEKSIFKNRVISLLFVLQDNGSSAWSGSLDGQIKSFDFNCNTGNISYKMLFLLTCVHNVIYIYFHLFCDCELFVLLMDLFYIVRHIFLTDLKLVNVC